jgi:serine/threonine protein kinase
MDEATKSFLAVACQESLITPEMADQVIRDADTLHQPVGEVLVQKGVMDPVEVDIVETLLHRDEVLPGYEILDVLGRGGMGVVYRARQKNLNRLVAIKTVLVNLVATPGTVARFEKEAVTVAGLRHPNIVTAYDFGRQSSRLYFVMELLEGEDLQTHIDRHTRLDEATAWGLARQAAWGLAHAAEHGIVHRDIKPSNLLLVKPPAGFELPSGLPMVKITDFGLVLLQHDVQSTRLTRAGASLGTPAYMAPEQFSNSAVDCRADIYALGATVYHMISGRVPFAGETVWQVMSQKMKGEPPELATIGSPDSVALIRQMMAEDPNKRIGGYPELLGRLDELTAHPSATTTVRESVQHTPPSRRLRWARVAVIALPIVVAAAVIAALWGRSTARRPPTQPLSELATLADRALFDGLTLEGWSTIEGHWQPSMDADGGNVLSGRGIILRPLIPPPPANYRLSMGVDIKQASAVELHFAFHQRTGEGQPRFVVHIARDGVFLGIAQRDGEAARPTSPVVPASSLNEDSSPYRELKIERQGNTWYAFFDGRPLGGLQALDGAELPEFRLIVEAGPALFEEIELAELAPGPASPGS